MVTPSNEISFGAFCGDFSNMCATLNVVNAAKDPRIYTRRKRALNRDLAKINI